MAKYGVKILATGSFLPEKVLTNKDLERMVDTTDEWITTRTGIKERRITDENTATSDLAIGASKVVLQQTGTSPEEIDLIIVATITPDMLFPSTACFVQKGLGAKNAVCFDVLAACSGFIYALACAKNFIESGVYKNALVIGAETLTKITDWQDRSTCVLFGDGAGAVLLTRTDEDKSSILSVYLGADGNQDDLLKLPGGGSRKPFSKDVLDKRLQYISMNGRQLFKSAVIKMIEASEKALEMCGRKPEDLALLIPHQANLRIIDALRERISLPKEKVFVNLDKYGNMSSATTIIGLDEAIREGRVKSGDLVELVAFGGGLTWAATVIRI
ncbi:MAG: 3-oxoacyl-ACP synthase [Elusimicrobia bacterium CG1_02_37_114]|nr:MAG: 3-oxoacyl-ACP synthase [Elusimicrobia bacterium CG1_02_37_114]PIV53942.1 MAG: 3-oxoacyl-ACP synthase [Elusimicrobia bacterium CG02_land_8_20_14_3_00_37_13]PIZ13630.1 MAG: 3-oxoacyl-ACP synthase [Elusimicrobia bacterium CG_4_10_14_0_8_um_filter_37_32]